MPHAGGKCNAKGSQALFVKFWFGRTRLLEVPGDIPPRWIRNAQKSRKRIEPEIVEALRSIRSIQRNRPRAQVALKNANKQFKMVLNRWEIVYSKENFYRGIRILLELHRNGSSKL